MAKDPAFLFYSQDWITGTQVLTFEDRGKYIHILALMHQQGRMDEETIRFLVGSISEKLKSKFKIDDLGKWYNVKLEEETLKRNNYTDSRKKNGKLGGRPSAGSKLNKENSDWEIMLEFFKNSCVCCGAKFPANERPTKDHIKPTIIGGTDDIYNLQPLCRECNASKGASHETDYRLKYYSTIPKKLKSIWFRKKNHMGNENENLDVDKILNYTFDEFWILYDKKVGNKDALVKKWAALTEQDRELAMLHIPQYKAATPDKKFRKDPSTYLNNKSFNDEIISNGTTKTNTGSPFNSRNGGFKILADSLREDLTNIAAGRTTGFTGEI